VLTATQLSYTSGYVNLVVMSLNLTGQGSAKLESVWALVEVGARLYGLVFTSTVSDASGTVLGFSDEQRCSN